MHKFFKFALSLFSLPQNLKNGQTENKKSPNLIHQARGLFLFENENLNFKSSQLPIYNLLFSIVLLWQKTLPKLLPHLPKYVKP